MLSDNENLISLADAADGTPYSQEYLSLLARKGKLPAKKIGRNWFTTKIAVANYVDEQKSKLLEAIEEKAATSDIGPNIVSDNGHGFTQRLSTRNYMGRNGAGFVLEEVADDRDLEVAPLFYRLVSSRAFRLILGVIGNMFLAGTILAGFFVVGIFGMNLADERSFEAARQKSQRDLQYFAAVAGERIGVLEFAESRLRIVAGALKDTGEIIANAILDLTGTRAEPTLPLLAVPSAPSKSDFDSKEVRLQTRGDEDASKSDFTGDAASLRGGTEVISEIAAPSARDDRVVREVLIPADVALLKTEIFKDVNSLNQAIRERFDKAIDDLTFKLSRTSSRAESSIQMVTLSQKIDNIDGATLRNVTFSGASGLTDNDIPNNITVTGGQSFSTLTLSGDLTTSGDLTFSSAATTTIPSSAVNAFSIATSSTAVPFMTFDTSNYRVGIGTSTPGTTFSVGGNALISGTLDVGGVFRANSSSLTVNNVPTTAHTFSTWAVNDSGASATTSSLVINPSSAASDTNLLGILVNSQVKFLVDAEGDTFVNSLTSAGSVTVASTSASSLLIEGSTYIGDSISDLFSINSGNIYYNFRATSTIPNLTVNAWSVATSSTVVPFFTMDTSNYRIGIATTAPAYTFSIGGAGNIYALGGATSTYLSSTYANLTNATSTYLSVATYASTSALTVSNDSTLRTLSGSGLFTLTGGLISNSASSTLLNLLSTYSTSTQATSTYLSVSSYASTSALRVDNLGILGNLQINASSTLQNFTALLSTSTQATSTYLSISNYASSSALTVSNASTFGGLSTFNFGLLSPASTTLTHLTSLFSTTTRATTTWLNVSTLASTSDLIVSTGLNIGTSTATTTSGTLIAQGILNIWGTGTSTFANGITLTTGCIKMPDGNCAGGTPGGTDSQIQYNNGGTAFGGAARLIWDDVNNVLGIATSTPSAVNALSIGGNTYFDSNIITISSSSASDLTISYQRSATSTIGSDVFNAFTIATSSVTTTRIPPLLSIGSSGGLARVGIGTSTPFSSFSIQSHPGQSMFNIGSSSQTSFIVDSKGYIGIGTSSPGALFSLSGQGTNLTSFLLAGINIIYASSSTTTIPNSTVNVWSIATSTTAAYPALSISTASTTVPALVGIGTTNPSAPLHVDKFNASTDNVLAIFGNSNSSINQNLFIETVGDNGNISLSAATNGKVAARTIQLNPNGGPVFIGDTANANMTQGLTINQGTNDDETFALKSSSDVAHGITGGSETDTFAYIKKVDNDRGGFNMSGYIETGETRAISIRGFSPTNTTSAATNARAHVMIHGYDVSGTGAANAAANSLIFGVLTQVAGVENSIFFVDAEGDLFSDSGAATAAFDEHTDAELIRAYEKWRTASKPDEIILNRWDEYVSYNKEDLEREEIISKVSEEEIAKGARPMISLTQLNRVQTGAAWQIYSKARDTELELTGADMAEWTKVTGSYSDYEPGDIMMFSSEDRKVEKSTSAKKELLVGVVALNPGPLGFSYVLDMDAVKILDKPVEEIEQGYNARMVTTIGYTPIKVSTENGPLQSGDAITASSIPGVGRKAKPGERIIGFAFESFDPSQGKMGTHDINLSTRTYKKFFRPMAKQLPDGKWQGWVFGYVNLGYSRLDGALTNADLTQTNAECPRDSASCPRESAATAWSIDQTSGKVNVSFFGTLNLNGNEIINVSKILGMDGKWSLDENGKLVVKEIETEKITTQELKVKNQEASKTGITIYDRVTGNPMCAYFASGILQHEEGECGQSQPTTTVLQEEVATSITATSTSP